MIRILIATIIVVVFANAASKLGKNPINWSLIGLACYLTPSYLAPWLLIQLAIYGITFGGSWTGYLRFAWIFGLATGIALTIFAYRRLTRPDSDQEF